MSRPMDLPRTLGFREGWAVLVGIIIGSGIFRSPGRVLAACGSPAWTLAAWVVGGVLSLLGALVVAELAARWPRTGGTYAFLKEAYGKPLAFGFATTGVLAFKPLAIAGIARVCAEYGILVAGKTPDPHLVGVLSVVLVVALTGFNAVGTQASARLQVVATAAKAVALTTLIVLAAAFPSQRGEGAPVFGASPGWSAFAGALASVLWAYDGWADVGYLAGEVRDPRRTLPKLFASGMLTVALLYILANVAYLRALDPAAMAASKTVAVDALRGLLGDSMAVRMAALAITISTFGALNASILSGGRIPFAAAADGLFPKWLAGLDARGTPRPALLLQGALSAMLAWSASFEELADAFVVATFLFYVPMCLAAVTLRRRLGAPTGGEYAMPWYPWPVVTFVVTSVAFLMARLHVDPLGRIASVVALLSTGLGYLLFRTQRT